MRPLGFTFRNLASVNFAHCGGVDRPPHFNGAQGLALPDIPLGGLRLPREMNMIQPLHRLAACVLLAGAFVLPARAELMISFGISESSAVSVGTSSASFGRSSDGSSRHGRHHRAEGDYKVIAVTAMVDQPGTARMKLQALGERSDGGADAEFYLYLPQQVVDKSLISAGQLVTAQQRPYGVAFAHTPGSTLTTAATQTVSAPQAFYLVLDDDWHRELRSHPVVL